MKNDILKTQFDEIIKSIILDWLKDGMSENEIQSKLTTDNIKASMFAVMEKSAENSFNYFKNHMFEIAYDEQAKTDEFISRQKQTWGNGFAASQTMYIMAVESAELFCKFVDEDLTDNERLSKRYTFQALQHMHGRACQIFLEIFHLMRLGFADGAYSRWRSLYELCCCADLIKNQGENIAEQYIEQAKTDNRSYSWANDAIDKDGNKLGKKGKDCSFSKIQNVVNIDSSWLAQYKLACLTTHASPQGTFARLANSGKFNLIPVGHSNYGITTAAEHSAICLCWITGVFITLFPHFDSDARCKVLRDWVEVIRDTYFTAHEEAFGEKIENKDVQ